MSLTSRGRSFAALEQRSLERCSCPRKRRQHAGRVGAPTPVQCESVRARCGVEAMPSPRCAMGVRRRIPRQNPQELVRRWTRWFGAPTIYRTAAPERRTPANQPLSRCLRLPSATRSVAHSHVLDCRGDPTSALPRCRCAIHRRFWGQGRPSLVSCWHQGWRFRSDDTTSSCLSTTSLPWRPYVRSVHARWNVRRAQSRSRREGPPPEPWLVAVPESWRG